MKPTVDQHRFKSKAALDETLTASIVESLQEAIAQRDRAVLVVSGGSTPKGLFERLSHSELDWAKVSVTLADERWVPVSHRDSNERLVREQLLINKANSATFLSLKTAHDSPMQAESFIDERLAELGAADVLVLGMGADGHTASLFPQANNLQQALTLDSTQHCIAIDPVTAAHMRMSMSLAFLLESREIFLHITGTEKLGVFEQACIERDARKAPIAELVKHARRPLQVFWAP